MARRRAPQLARIEAHRVQILRLLARAVGIRIRKHERGMHAVDDAALAAHVAGQARVSGGMGVARAHRPTGGVAWRGRDGPLETVYGVRQTGARTARRRNGASREPLLDLARC